MTCTWDAVWKVLQPQPKLICLVCTLTSGRISANFPKSREGSAVVSVWVWSHMPIHNLRRCSYLSFMNHMDVGCSLKGSTAPQPKRSGMVCTLASVRISAIFPKSRECSVVVMVGMWSHMPIHNLRRCSNTSTVNCILMNYPFFLFPERTVVELASKIGIEKGRHTFCLSFLGIGESSQYGATYPQNCEHPSISQKGSAHPNTRVGYFCNPSPVVAPNILDINVSQFCTRCLPLCHATSILDGTVPIFHLPRPDSNSRRCWLMTIRKWLMHLLQLLLMSCQLSHWTPLQCQCQSPLRLQCYHPSRTQTSHS